MSIEHIINFMTAPPDPAKPVITIQEGLAERVLAKLEGIDSASSEVAELHGLLGAPLVPLWAIHCVGPGEIYPAFSKEDGERMARDIIEACRRSHERWVAKGNKGDWIDPVINLIPSPWEPAEHFELLAEQEREESDRLRAGWIEAENKAKTEESTNG